MIAKVDCRVFCHINFLENKISNTDASIQPNPFWFWEKYRYIGLTEGTFKKRFTGHKSTFSNEKLRLSLELSKKIWSLKDDGKQYNITWDIVKRTNPRKAGKNTCDLCNTEKLAIIQEIRRKNTHLLNKRSEIVSKCRHVNKFLLKSF